MSSNRRTFFWPRQSRRKGICPLASRSLAPPGHSFHGVGDFDVGKVGLGASNFTDVFAETAEFQQLVDLGYVSMRYPKDNQLGVRYEPWHVKVVSALKPARVRCMGSARQSLNAWRHSIGKQLAIHRLAEPIAQIFCGQREQAYCPLPPCIRQVSSIRYGRLVYFCSRRCQGALSLAA